ncbi:MAG: helix-turn-helix domain-containing protein [Limisphaerales bacterium]
MQAFYFQRSGDFPAADYDAAMRKKDRPPLGLRLTELRQAAGLTQIQLADKLGVHPSNIGFWELSGTPPRGEVLPKMAHALGVSVDALLGVTPPKPKRQAAKGRLQSVFEAASKLPRRQQEKVAEFVGAFVKQHANGNP